MPNPIPEYCKGLEITNENIEKWKKEYSTAIYEWTKSPQYSTKPPANKHDKIIRNEGYSPILFIPDSKFSGEIVDTYKKIETEKKYDLWIVDAEGSGKILYAKKSDAEHTEIKQTDKMQIP